MAETVEIRVPELGGFDQVDVSEVLVKPGDRVTAGQGLITLESDKASMEVPSPDAGTVREIKVAVGAKIGEGTVIAVLEVEAGSAAAKEDSPASKPEATPAAAEASEPPPAKPETPAPSARALPDADFRCEILVLGGGPGGYTAAFRAADLGKKVVLVERYATLGGVCTNVGCIPSKALLHAARVIEEAAELREHGLGFGAPEVDVEKLRAWKDGVVKRLTGGLGLLARQRKVELVTGRGAFTSPHTLAVETAGGTRTVAFEQAIVAAGSRAVKLPGFPWDDPRVMDSTDALEIREVPRRLLVVGGGIIGLEMATVFHALGSRITVVELLDGLIPGADRDLVKPLEKRLRARYEAIHLKTKVTKVEAEPAGLRASFDGPDSPSPALFDHVLVAVGRAPNGKSIGAEAAGIEVDDRGCLRVDNQMRTNVPHVFAIGDVVPGPMLAHKAMAEAKVAAEVAAGHRRAFDARVIPSVAYTDPEIAWAGLTETEAKAKGIQYGRGAYPWSASGRSLSLGRDEGLTKLLFDESTGRVLGAGIVGPNAGDLIAEAALAIEMGADAEDLGLTIHPHPTLSETVGLAADVFAGSVVEILAPKRARKG